MHKPHGPGQQQPGRLRPQCQAQSLPRMQEPPAIMAAAIAAAAMNSPHGQPKQSHSQKPQTQHGSQSAPQRRQKGSQWQQQQPQPTAMLKQLAISEELQRALCPRSDKDGAESVVSGTSKGVISLLQEFVQCSRQFHAPQHRPILQWTFDNRMADFTTLEFRGAVAFLLDGVPHHVAGTWHPSKKLAQRDAAERALGFFVGKWGEQLLREQNGCVVKPPMSNQRAIQLTEIDILDSFCRSYPACEGQPPQWSFDWDGDECRAVAEITLLGVPHKFAGAAKATEEEAGTDTTRRVLWYLQCPGYEGVYAPDPHAPAVIGKEIPAPPTNWANDGAEGCADQMAEAEKKTALMRVQNRLQQAFARQLKPGQSVWEWAYETDEDDSSWPPLCRATVTVAVAARSFTGDWARGQRAAQIEACNLVSTFLADGGLTRTPSRVSSRDMAYQEDSGDCYDAFELGHVCLAGGDMHQRM